MKVEDRLQGAQNFPTWKEKITRILDVSDAEEHIDSTKVAPTDLAYLAAWKKIDSRAMLIILDGVKDHIVRHLSGFREEDRIRDVEGFGRSLRPKQEWKLEYGATGEVT